MPLDSYGATTTAAEIVNDVDLHGRRAVVTGASSGIGVETARALASAGADVTLAVRNIEAGARVADEIAEKLSSAGGGVHVARLDLADPASVDDFVRAWAGPLHILVNNAGVMALPQLTRTPSGYEMQFATNHLGHFVLATGLHASLAAASDARVVSVASIGHLFSPVVFDDLHFDFRAYDPFAAYGQSKTAGTLLAVEATRRWSGEGIYANALNPGAIATGLQQHTGGLRTPRERQKTVEQGAATSVLLAASPLLDKVGGRYFEDCNEAAVVTRRTADYTGVAWYAVDQANAGRLWDTARDLLPA